MNEKKRSPRNSLQQLYADWEDAVEGAAEQAPRPPEIAQANLNTIVGVRVQSRVQAGLWGDSKYCEH